MKRPKVVGLTLTLLVCGHSGQLQNPTAPRPCLARQQVNLIATLVDFSTSSMVMRFAPVKPSAAQLGLKEHQLIVLPLPIEWKTLQLAPNSPYPHSPHFVSPEGKRISPYDLEPGMRVRLKGTLWMGAEEAEIQADTVQLVSWKLYSPPARLRGALIEVDRDGGGNRGKLQVGDRTIAIQLCRHVQLLGNKKWQRDFERRRLHGLRLGMELEIRGYWFSRAETTVQQGATNDPYSGATTNPVLEEVLVEEIRIVKDR